MTKRSSVADYLRDFERQGKACAYLQHRGYRTEHWSYRHIVDLAAQFAHELQARNIRKDDRIMFWGENCAQWVAAFFGCAIAGAAVVPMDDGASPEFVMRVFRQVGAKLLVCSQEYVGQCAQIVSPSSTMTFEDLSHSVGSHPTEPIQNTAVSLEDVLQIVFTSGTTAEPRGVVITHGNVLANVAPLEEQIQSYLKYERFVHPVRFLNLLPLSHVFGQFLGLFLPPLLGGIVIFQRELKPSEIVRTMKRERVSVLVSVPRILQSLKQKVQRDLQDEKKNDFQQRFRSSEGKHFLRRWWTFRRVHRQLGWKFWAFISGGAALDADTEEFWGRLGYAVIQGYGLTETTSLISVNHPFKLGKGSIGKVLPGREVKLAEDGEILVRGAGVAASYFTEGGPGQNGQRLCDDAGWYRTGDIGALDEQGNLYFKGRKKEVIVTPGGTKVYPEDLEAALRLQPEVKDCVVVGIERGGNAEPCAVLILRGQASPAAVVDRANHSLAEYQRMHLWLEWPEEDFPRTATQKPRRNSIRELAQVQIIHSATSQIRTTHSPLVDLVSRFAERPIAAVGAGVTLDLDLGLSSLDRVELLSVLEDRYQVELSETRFSTARTIGDLERMLRSESVQRKRYHYPGWTLRWPATWLRLLAHYLLLRPAVMLLGWPRIEGRENLRGCKGPLLVVSNHIGDVDLGFIQTALPARIRHRLATATGGEALEALRTPPANRGFLPRIFARIQWALGVCLLNLFPLPREAGFRQSFAYAGEAVDRGYSVLIFPEGHQTVDGKINPFRAGIGLLAQNLEIPVLPMRIDGLFELKQAGKKFAPPLKIVVRIGEPVVFGRDMLPEQIAQELQKRVSVL